MTCSKYPPQKIQQLCFWSKLFNQLPVCVCARAVQCVGVCGVWCVCVCMYVWCVCMVCVCVWCVCVYVCVVCVCVYVCVVCVHGVCVYGVRTCGVCACWD